VSTCLKSLEMLGNFSDVKEMSGISVKIKGLSGKKILSRKIAPKLF